MKAMCDFLGVSRAAYYAWVERMDQPDPDAVRLEWVRSAWENSRRTYGYRRITLWLRQQGRVINHKTVRRLMNKLQIRSIARQPNPFRRNSHLSRPHLYQNVLNRDFTASQPNQKWVTDITYIATQSGWAFLSVIKDLFDGFIIAHQLARHNSIRLVLDTLEKARQAEPLAHQVLLHSDQGFQYTSQQYTRWIRRQQMDASMSRKANCWDNAPMESFFAQLKEEMLRHIQTPTMAEVQVLIEDYINFYNYERIQLKTKQTPAQTRCLSR